MSDKRKERIIQFLMDYLAHIAVAATIAVLGWGTDFFQGLISWIADVAMQAL